MKFRLITAAIIQNTRGEYLLCQMASDHGVYPNQWGIVGGGVEPDEEIDHAIVREIQEESQLQVTSMKRLFFADAHKEKTIRGSQPEDQYLVFLVYEAQVRGEVQLNDEWQSYKWCSFEEVLQLDLNEATQKTFTEYFRLQKIDEVSTLT